jgi:hypothetical protein
MNLGGPRSPAIGQPISLDYESSKRVVLARIVGRIRLFETPRIDGRHLGHVLAGLRPVEVGRIAGQNDDAAGRIGPIWAPSSRSPSPL